MMYRINKFFRDRAEMRETSRAVSQYLWDHYTLRDLISGRWRYIPVQNPYYRNSYHKRSKYERACKKCGYGTFYFR